MKKILVSLLIVLVSCNNSNKSENSLEGRLKDENMILKDDKRLNPNLLSALKKYGMDGEAAKSPVDVNASNEDKLKFVNESEPLYQGLFSAIFIIPIVINPNLSKSSGSSAFIHSPVFLS